MIWGAMGKRMKVIMSVLLLLLSCVTTGLLVGAVGSTQSSVTTLSMRPLPRDAAGEGTVISHKRLLLTTRNAPIGFPPPPAMAIPAPPEY